MASVINRGLENDINSHLNLPASIECLSLFRPNIRDTNALVKSLVNLKSLKQLSLHCVECLNDEAMINVCSNFFPVRKMVFYDKAKILIKLNC